MSEYIVPIDRTRLAATQKKWQDVFAAIENLPCITEDQEKWWAGHLADAQAELVSIEADREELVRPLIDSKTSTDKAFKEVAAFPEKVKALCKVKIGAAREARLATQQALRLQAAEAAARGDSTAVLAAVQAIPDEVVTKGAGGGWAWEPSVVDSSAVPEAYKTVDLKKLQAYAKAFASSDTIPVIRGVVFKRVSRVIAGKR